MVTQYLEQVRDFAAQNLINRALVYTASTIIAAMLASLTVAFLKLPATPPYEILMTVIYMIVLFYFIDPENEYTESDFLAIFVAAIFLTLFMAWAGYAAQASLIKQYAAPLVYMQEAANAAAQALQVPSTDFLGLALMNIWSWLGGLGVAMGIKMAITQRTA